MRVKLTPQQQNRAVGMIESGQSHNQVARQFNVDHKVIDRLWDRYQTTGTTVERPRSGRPRATSARDDRYVVNMALRDRRTSANTLKQRLRTATHVNVSDQTIRNRLRAANLNSRCPALKPCLTQRHRQARYQFATQHLRWNQRNWRMVLFSDESRFIVNQNDGRIRVWRRVGERYADPCVIERNNSDRGGVMVWGGISWSGKTELVFIYGRLNEQRYINDILTPHVIPALQAIGNGAIFQDDNAQG